MRLTMVTRYYGLPIFIVIKCMEPASGISNRACSNNNVLLQYYREAGTSLIQHICAILAFESGSYGTPNTP